MTIVVLLAAMLVILVGAEVFTNALEHLGERLGISEGVTGSIFAAIGTAMPETMVPLVALLSGVATQDVREQVGIGAILGAPLMLSTLVLFLLAMFALYRRGWRAEFHPERSGLRRDLDWFAVGFGLATVAVFVPADWSLLRAVIASALVGVYLLYLMLTVRASAKLVADGHGTAAENPLYLARALKRVGLRENFLFVLLQLAAGLALIIGGARGFVYGVETLATALGLTALALSLLIVPLATELPETVNSFLWLRRGKDTLAFGNITGAMVFQGTLLPALGILLTPWSARTEVVGGLFVTLAASMFTLTMLRRGVLRPYHMLVNGLCYVAYLFIILSVRT